MESPSCSRPIEWLSCARCSWPWTTDVSCRRRQLSSTPRLPRLRSVRLRSLGYASKRRLLSCAHPCPAQARTTNRSPAEALERPSGLAHPDLGNITPKRRQHGCTAMHGYASSVAMSCRTSMMCRMLWLSKIRMSPRPALRTHPGGLRTSRPNDVVVRSSTSIRLGQALEGM